jgi:hypothetical protein
VGGGADELRKLSWSGIPDEFRPFAWKILMVRHATVASHPILAHTHTRTHSLSLTRTRRERERDARIHVQIHAHTRTHTAKQTHAHAHSHGHVSLRTLWGCAGGVGVCAGDQGAAAGDARAQAARVPRVRCAVLWPRQYQRTHAPRHGRLPSGTLPKLPVRAYQGESRIKTVCVYMCVCAKDDSIQWVYVSEGCVRCEGSCTCLSRAWLTAIGVRTH